jgi:putative ATP-dependent endonuclease of the OLD family
LVEGQTEEYALPIYAEAVGKALDELGVAVVECGGKCSMDRHFRIFNELGIPCYLLMDYDKSNDDQNIVAKSRELLALMGQDTDAPEGFAAFERIACFEEKWETTQRAAVADYEALHADATAHLGPAGKPLVERYLARRLTTEDPPRVPEHIRAIIDRALAVEWNDTCLVQVANEE